MSSTNLVSGLSSGFDWRSMIDQVINIDHQKVDIVENQKTEYESKLSEWQSFNNQLLSLKTSAENIADPEAFNLFTTGMSTDSATIDSDDLVSVSVDSDAAPGTYTVTVTNLATAQKFSSNPFTSQTTELGSSYAGDIIINGLVITISNTDSLADAAYRINDANTGDDPSGVTAGIIKYGTGDYRLMLTSDDTGEEGINLANGSSTDLVQKFGWKDNETSVIKNSITNGAQSDQFTTSNVAVKSLLGLATGETSTGTLAIGGSAVTINLSTMSLTDIKTAINDASIAGVTASVIAQTLNTDTLYRLQIDGTQTLVDENNILNTLGIIDHTSNDVTGKVSGNSMTADGTYITSDTLLADIDAYNTFTSGGQAGGGDYITLTGNDTDGSDIGSINFDISSTTTAQDLLDTIEAEYGEVIAYVTADGKLRVDDLSGGASLSVQLTDHINDANSQLEFMTGDAVFTDASSRKREIVAGEDASVEIDGTEVTSSSNIIEDVIAGVTLNIVKEDAATNITLSIDRNISGIKGKVQDFVEKFNSAMTYINSQFTYDEDDEKVGGVLFGDGTLRSVKSDLTSLLTDTIWGVNTDFSTMGLAGITMDDNLQLNIDDEEFSGYLETNFNDIMALFTAQGATSNSSLSYIDHSRDSKAGEYTIHIDTAATRGSGTGSVDLSSGGADDTLTITKGNNTAEISITADMILDDIINEINTELDTEYTQAVVGAETLYSDGSQTSAITSETTWDSMYDSLGTQLGFSDSDTLSFSGTARNGSEVSGSYTISSVSSDAVQGLLSSIENSFSNNVTAYIDSSGRIAVTDKYSGTSQLAIDSISHTDEGEFFGDVDVTDGAGDNSQEGRYAIAVTAYEDGNYLMLTNDDYGSTSFTISQLTSELGLSNGDIAGLDVAGTINGESATGLGQSLSGDDDNANTDGLSITYTGTSNDVDAGTIKLTLGVAELFDRTLFGITDSIDGYVAFKQDSLQNSINSFDTKIEWMEARLNKKTETMINRFVAMELALGKLQNQSDWLAGQLSAAFKGWG